MAEPLPVSHITDALKLEGADGIIDLYELMPTSGGTVRFKSDNSMSWLGVTYEGLPMTFSGDEQDMEKTPEPQLRIGQEDADLLALKGLVFDGHLESATIIRKRVLLDDLLNNRDIKHVSYYRVKRVSEYSRTSINLTLSGYSSATKQTIPFRQYIPPAFPWVDV